MNPLDYAAQIAYSSKETLQFTFEKAKELTTVKGCFVECGVAAGAQIIAMAYGAPNKMIYAYDSFQGIPLPSNRDDQMPGIRLLKREEQNALPAPGRQELVSTGATAVSILSFTDHLLNAKINTDNIIVVQGWFEETVHYFTGGKIALLRLDGDLYNSTYVCLSALFTKVVRGGCVIIDDWTLPGCRAACDDYFYMIGYKPDYKFLSTIAYFHV